MDGISESEVPFFIFQDGDSRARAFRIKTLVSQRQYYVCHCGMIILSYNTNSNTGVTMDVTWLVDEYLGTMVYYRNVKRTGERN